jgi:Fe-S oxidoreductase
MNAAQFGQALDEKMDRSLYSSLQACVRCGLCAESCHYYVNDPLPQYMPAARAEEVRKLWRPTAVHRLAGRDGDSRKLEHLRDIVFGSCTMCGRCTLNCPVGVDTAGIMRAARGILSSGGYLPKGLGDTVASHLEAGNNMGVSQEEYLDTVEWMEEQLQDEVGDSNARIPVDKKGAAYLYTMNPREIKFYPCHCWRRPNCSMRPEPTGR